MPAFRIASASRRMPVFALALVALSIGAAPAVAAEPASPQGRELGPRRAAFLPAAARARSSCATARPAPPTSSCSMPPARQGRAAVPARDRDGVAGARRRPGALGRARLAPGAARIGSMRLRYQIQLLVALNRIADVEEPLSALLRQTARPALPGLIEALPRLLGARRPIAMPSPRSSSGPCGRMPTRPTRGRRRRSPSAAPGSSAGDPAKALDVRAARERSRSGRRRRGAARPRHAAGDARGRGDRQAPARRREQTTRRCGCCTCERWRRRSASPRRRPRSRC